MSRSDSVPGRPVGIFILFFFFSAPLLILHPFSLFIYDRNEIGVDVLVLSLSCNCAPKARNSAS